MPALRNLRYLRYIGVIGWLSGTLLLATPVGAAVEDAWAEVLATTAQSVVSLQIAQLRNFDDSEQGSSNATGFVVDAKRGIILTNRHVVGAGPIRLSATFQNQERVPAVPLYRDPVHDFAFVRYDPDDLEYAMPRSLPLRPEKVRTGMNVRVIGSDGGEQLSILTGTIARLDREVPSYGRYGYNDFNTFYLQAASSTSGGSSGSPVIDFTGDVIALNAAANAKTASSFFLPLWRVRHALERLQANESIPRGSLQALFRHRPYRELARLGLSKAQEERLRRHDPDNKGMLVVSQVIPGGVASKVLEEGDILLSIDDTIVTDFIALEALLDVSIGKSLSVEFVRQGETTVRQLEVADLHAIEPKDFLEVGDSVLQDMSIQHARAMNRPQAGVVVMRPGFFFTRAGFTQGAVIVEVNRQPVARLDDFLSAVRASARQQKLTVKYILPGREFVTRVAQVDIDDRWFGHRRCTRVDDRRFWDCQAVQLTRKRGKPVSASPVVPRFDDTLLDRVAPGMVRVRFSVPYPADNVYARHFEGVGIIVDRENGLVAVDRNTVPIGLGDAEITLFDSLVLDASVVFLHPRHNIALLKYDAEITAGSDFEALNLEADDAFGESDAITFVGYRADGTFRRQAVTEVSRVTVNFDAPSLPRFQQAPLDVYGVPNLPPSIGGPFVDEDGDVHALLVSFAYEDGREIRQQEMALPASLLTETLRLYRSDNPYYSLDAMLTYRSMADARELGLPDSWLARYRQLDANSRRVLYVEQIVPDTNAAEALHPGDIVVAIDDELVANLFDAELAWQRPLVRIDVLRDGEVISVNLKPSALQGLGTERLVSWSGALFQNAHPEIGFFKSVSEPGVYITHTAAGSPSIWDSLYRNRFVTAVDGIPVSNLDEFLDQVSAKQQDEITRLSVVTMSGRKRIVTVQPEYNYWPTFEVKRTADGWKRINYLN